MYSRSLDWKPQHSVIWACTSSICQGICLMLMGVAPTLIDQFVARTPLPVEMQEAASIVFLMGLASMAFGVLVKFRFVTGALLAFALSATLAYIAFMLITQPMPAVVFVLVLALTTALANLIAVVSIIGNRQRAINFARKRCMV